MYYYESEQTKNCSRSDRIRTQIIEQKGGPEQDVTDKTGIAMPEGGKERERGGTLRGPEIDRKKTMLKKIEESGGDSAFCLEALCRIGTSLKTSFFARGFLQIS
jgi:hypothetical protein